MVSAVTGITLTTADIDATHAAMRELGVAVDAQVLRVGACWPSADDLLDHQ